MRKNWDKSQGKSHKNQTHESCAGVHQPHVLQTSDQHLHMMRKGWWLSAGVSEINLRNPALNHMAQESLHSSFHFTIWSSEMWPTMGKTWTVQISQLKVDVKSSRRKTSPTWETITTMRTWAVTKASRLKAVLLRTKTIWVMVRSMRETRQSMRGSARQSMRVRTRQNTRIRMRRKIKELITTWVSSILKAPLLNSLTPEAKLI
jgi:hypothetical protein